MSGLYLRVTRFLDGLYTAGGVIAAGFLLALLGLIVAQMAARWTGHVFPGSTDYSGYCMAGASFFALSHALGRGAHIRVSLFLNWLGEKRRIGELWCFGIGSVIAVYFAYYAVKATYWSHKLNDISQGQDAMPLWIPQLVMAVGTVLLATAMVDNFIRVIVLGESGVIAETVEDHHA